jgi:hypothetical protein
VVEVRIDRSDEADEPDRPAADAAAGSGDSGDRREGLQLPRPEQSMRPEGTLAHRATVDDVYRRHAIDQGCARVEKLEREIVTPAMRRVEAKTPTGP